MIKEYANRWALVTGASSGIGEAFAHKLAARGMHLILTARREEPLHKLAGELHTRHGTNCEILLCNLSEIDGPKWLADEIEGRDIELELLVNNAGFGVVGDFEHTDVDTVMSMLRLNIGAVTELAYRILPGMLERGHGGIINVASTAGFQPVAYMPAYAASKAYVLHFSEAMWAEAYDRGVTVMALCPGTTRTAFFDTAGVAGWLKKHRSQTPEQVVKAALKGLDKRRSHYVSGWQNHLLSLAVRMAPRKMVVRESMKYFRPQPQSGQPRIEQPSVTQQAPSDDAP